MGGFANVYGSNGNLLGTFREKLCVYIKLQGHIFEMGLQIIFRSHASWLMLSSRRNKSRDGVCMHIDILVNFLRHG